MNWWYTNPFQPSLDEVAREINGWALADVKDEKDPKTVVLKPGEQLGKFLDARADGSTLQRQLAVRRLLHPGRQPRPAPQQCRSQRHEALRELGLQLARQPPRHVQPLLRRRQGQPWDPKRPVIKWNGEKWVGDVPDYKPDSPPEAGMGAFIMLPEGVARLFVPGSSPRVRSPSSTSPWNRRWTNPLHAPTSTNPAVKPFKGKWDRLGKADEFPIVATTYRLTEHFHYWTKNNAYNVELQPEFFVEISEELAKEKSLKSGDMVKVTSARGSIQGKAMVTKRIKPMQVAGKTVHQIGFPIHWGFLGRGEQAGAMANIVTPTIVDPNSFAPEYKGFLVKLEKV